MNPADLDTLSRRLASGGVTRRGALKALAFAAITAGLRAVGLRAPNAYADDVPAPAPQAGGLKLYLPSIQRACTEASRCGARKYCDERLGCLCVQTTEGDIRCGLLPSCDVKLCASSADCAELGPGAFCDTPLSGCCTSPPNTLSRCLLPCPKCAAEQQCGSGCCGEGQVCRNAACATVQTCATDPITDASLAAAQAALAGGATDIALSPNGCQRYRRTLVGGVLTQERMLLNGFIVQTSNYPVNGASEILIDVDQDGINELQTYVYYAPNSTRMTSRLSSRYDSRTRRLLRRRNETRKDDTTVHVIAEEWDTAGTQISREEFDASLLVTFGTDTIGAYAAPATEGIAAPTGCGAFDQTLRDRLKDGLKKGVACLDKYKHPHTSDFKRFQLSPNVIFMCDTALSAYAQYQSGDLPKGTAVINVNPNSLQAPSATHMLPGESINDFQSRVLFHELGHFYESHSPRTENYSQFDKTRACDALCFNTDANQCHCQTCLGDKTCNNGCSALPACQSSIQQCGNRCCAGPCDGSTCCPSERICNKKSNETAVCCPTGEECINLAGGSSSCCPSGQICRATGAGEGEEGKEICCQPGDTCGTDPAGNPTCVTPKIVCPACPARGRALQCFPANQASNCQAACSNGGLACINSCRPANPGECP